MQVRIQLICAEKQHYIILVEVPGVVRALGKFFNSDVDSKFSPIYIEKCAKFHRSPNKTVDLF